MLEVKIAIDRDVIIGRSGAVVRIKILRIDARSGHTDVEHRAQRVVTGDFDLARSDAQFAGRKIDVELRGRTRSNAERQRRDAE